MADLCSSLRVVSLELHNRIWMAPLTRCRAEDGYLPGALIAEHYAQRAAAGLILSGATMVMEGHSALWHEPGIYSQAQIEGWRCRCGACSTASRRRSGAHRWPRPSASGSVG